EEKLLNVKDKLWKKAKKLSEIRKKQAVELEKLLIKALKELNFSYVDLKIDINQEEHISSKGYDFVEFLISVNPGGEKQPLNKVSSGGELSRIMLALKSIMAKKEEISTLIFDEIDTGISGKTAWKVSQKMGILGREHQILCITHLPQIAAMSDRHFLIEKVAKENTSTTYIRKLQEEEEVLEISRLLAASEVTNVVIENAKELKKMAKDTKK
ncbi:MAG: DNA repair protein RecN, partial [Lachnospiraceae bacterium]